MKRRQFLKGLGRSAAGFAGVCGLPHIRSVWAGADAEPPLNFVFILVDDFGWTDVSYQGSPFYETPSIDALAAQGMKFTNAYAASPLCSPTRASIITGKSPARLHLTQAITANSGSPGSTASDRLVITPGIIDNLPLEEVTFAELLQTAGYTTGFYGKWHVCKDPAYFPEYQGFDVNFGGTHNPSPPSYFSPYNISNIPDGPAGEYLTDRLGDETVAFLEANKDNPFLLYFSHYAVHGPWQAKQEIIDKYVPRVDPQAGHRNPTYAAMIESMDSAVGQVLQELDSLGIADRTVVMFMSDNGGLTEVPGTAGTSSNVGDHITSNAPLRGGKAFIYEGGIREPMIVRWPGVTPPGSVCHTPVTSEDFYPTMLEMAGVADAPGHIRDGESIVPLLQQTGTWQRDTLYFHFPHYIAGYRPDPDQATWWTTPCAAIREGDYKLIEFFEDRVELYNLANDIGESNDLAASMPAKAADMKAKLDQWLIDVGADVPPPNPNYSPSYLGWKAMKDCKLSLVPGAMKIASSGTDPYIHGPTISFTGPVEFHLRIKSPASGGGIGQVFWITEESTNWESGKRESFTLIHDGEWHEYAVALPVVGTLTKLRLDPGNAGSVANPVEMHLDWIRLYDTAAPEPNRLYSWNFGQQTYAPFWTKYK